jgi:hypothetical protein
VVGSLTDAFSRLSCIFLVVRDRYKELSLYLIISVLTILDDSDCRRPPILHTVQEYFGCADKVRCNMCEKARPSRLNLQLNLQRYKVDSDTMISTSSPQRRTKHSCIEGSISPTGLDIKIIWM